MSENIMGVKVEDVSPVKKKLVFDISWLEVKNELDAVYKDVGKKAKVKGFRQGKIPRNILESMYKDYAEDEAITNLVNRYYWEALKANNISAVAQPNIDQKGIEAEKNFTFTATVEVEPVVKPEGYLGLELEKEEHEVSESDVDARLQEIREMFGTMEEVAADRGAKEGDFVVIDFEGTQDGKILKEMKADNYLLEVGSKTFVPGFEEQLIGIKKGENKQIRIKIPDDYHAKHLAGKEVLFSVTLKNIKEKKLPEIDEKFVQNFDKFETLDDLKKDIRKTLTEENIARSNTVFKGLIIDKLLEVNKFEVPQSFVDRQVSFMIADMQRRMAMRGIKRQDTSELYNKFYDLYKDEALKVVMTILLIKCIAEKESITVSDEELEEKIQEIAAQRSQTYDSLKKSLEDGKMIEDIKSEILNAKVFSFIEKEAKIKIIKN
ncbi:MAG TPA: trigger factor [Syntrophales bacterium]|nr:trigger factor [Syntrophales bacterium]